MTLTAEYDRLFIDKQSPDAYRSMSAVASAVAGTAKAAGLDQLLVELVNIRISQLNGCGFCLDMHIKDAIKEVAFVVNYFFWDHNNKISWDVTWVKDNSGVNTSSAGYMFGASRGVIIEDGIMMRIQWQINF